MPERPKDEPARRGLQPAMEGAKILHAEARRKDLRFPFQKDFVSRLDGQTVTGLGRRAKYLLADLAFGGVLLMHLGMFASSRMRTRKRRADSIIRAARIAPMTMWCSTCHRARLSSSMTRVASLT